MICNSAIGSMLRRVGDVRSQLDSSLSTLHEDGMESTHSNEIARCRQQEVVSEREPVAWIPAPLIPPTLIPPENLTTTPPNRVPLTALT